MSIFPCPTCGTAPVLTSGAVVWPNRPDLADKPVWRCTVCPDAHVTCHPNTTDPLGTPGDRETRRARRMLHGDMLDPLWQNADVTGGYGVLDDEGRRVVRLAARSRVYGFLAEKMGLTRATCHVGGFTLEQCRTAWMILRAVTYPDIRAWATEIKRSAKPKKRSAA